MPPTNLLLRRYPPTQYRMQGSVRLVTKKEENSGREKVQPGKGSSVYNTSKDRLSLQASNKIMLI